MSDRPWEGRRLHVVGVAGSGMSAYALAAHRLGATVTGSDRRASRFSDRLASTGVLEPAIGHDAANIPEGDDVEVVCSAAIAEDNPERVAAASRGLRVLGRGELLGELTALRRTIAVAGAHGKTTTASMIAHVLIATGQDPCYLIGGDLRSTGSNAGWGEGEWLVVEADESDRSMLELSVEIAVVTNVELDHHATFSSLAEVREVFRRFLAGPQHAVIWDRPELLALREGPVVAYDVPEPDVTLGPEGSRFDWRGHEVSLPVPGLHNARNAAGALETALLAGTGSGAAAGAISSFEGAGRRMEAVGETASGAAVYDDYAHHPTAVRATIAAARTLGPRRLIAVFQPHLYSRTAALAEEFGRALAEADVSVVLDVYPSRERAEDFPGVSGLLVARAAAAHAGGRMVCWLPDREDARALTASVAHRGDLVLVMGAGDIDVLSRQLVA